MNQAQQDYVQENGVKAFKAIALITSLVVSSVVYEINVGFPRMNKPFQRSCSNSTLSALADAFEASTVARDYVPYVPKK